MLFAPLACAVPHPAAQLLPEGPASPRASPTHATLTGAAGMWDDGADGDPGHVARVPASSSPMHTAQRALSTSPRSPHALLTRSGGSTGSTGSTPRQACTASGAGGTGSTGGTSGASSSSPAGGGGVTVAPPPLSINSRWALPHVAVHLQQPLALTLARDLVTLSQISHRIADLRLDIPSRLLLPPGPSNPPSPLAANQPPSPASPNGFAWGHSEWENGGGDGSAVPGPGPSSSKVKARARAPPLLAPLGACGGLRRLDLNFHEWALAGGWVGLLDVCYS